MSVGRTPSSILDSKDYTRNGRDGLNRPVLIGRYLGDERTSLLCPERPDREIFKLVLASSPPQGQLDPVCNVR